MCDLLPMWRTVAVAVLGSTVAEGCWGGKNEPLGIACAQVIAKAYDNPIPGYKTNTVGNLRLWEALPVEEFDLSAFNKGEYDKVGPLHRDIVSLHHAEK
jgi:glucan phosphorylase